jgi:hypothetical protein
MTTSLRHAVPGCWRTPVERDGQVYCEGRDCHYPPPAEEVVLVDPLGEIPGMGSALTRRQWEAGR